MLFQSSHEQYCAFMSHVHFGHLYDRPELKKYQGKIDVHFVLQLKIEKHEYY